MNRSVFLAIVLLVAGLALMRRVIASAIPADNNPPNMFQFVHELASCVFCLVYGLLLILQAK